MNYNKQLKIDNLDFNLIQDLSEKESKKVSGGQTPAEAMAEVRAAFEASKREIAANIKAVEEVKKKFGFTP